MPTPVAPELERLLQAKFLHRHVRSAVKHFQEMTLEYQKGDWEKSIAKGGKFIEAALKALILHTGGVLPAPRQFKAGNLMTALENLPVGSYGDAVRVTIPRACRFAYDIANNRGARHDPDEVDPNQMDARAVTATVAWVLAEMLRYAQKGAMDQERVRELVDSLTQRKYPVVEEVDDRTYFHVRGASGRDVALLSLWHVHPGRMTRQQLLDALGRHRYSQPNARMALTRLAGLVDEAEGGLRLLQPGLRLAEELIASAGTRP